MSPASMETLVEAYLALRRKLGCALQREGALLPLWGGEEASGSGHPRRQAMSDPEWTPALASHPSALSNLPDYVGSRHRGLLFRAQART